MHVEGIGAVAEITERHDCRPVLRYLRAVSGRDRDPEGGEVRVAEERPRGVDDEPRDPEAVRDARGRLRRDGADDADGMGTGKCSITCSGPDDMALISPLLLVHGSGSRGDRLPAGGSSPVQEHRDSGGEQGSPDGDQGDLPAGHAGADHVDSGHRDRRDGGSPDIGIPDISRWVRYRVRRRKGGGRCQQDPCQPGQDSRETRMCRIPFMMISIGSWCDLSTPSVDRRAAASAIRRSADAQTSVARRNVGSSGQKGGLR